MVLQCRDGMGRVHRRRFLSFGKLSTLSAMIRRAVVVLALLVPTAVEAEDLPRLEWPVDCRLGETCWLLTYPDTDPGPGARDFRCRTRSYDGHDGTDIAIADRRAMERGVAVRAAAPGVVLGMRDGEPDGAHLAGAAVDGKECGNGVHIRLDTGWLARYCHMRAGSVAVRTGQRVAEGDRLGLVGLSGLTAFPHLHLDVRHDGGAVDPFTGAGLAEGCGRPARPLWRQSPGYEPAALYALGFADHVPSEKDIKESATSPPALRRDRPIVLWGAMLGVAAGDRVTLALTGPDGGRLVEATVTIKKDQAWRYQAAARKLPAGGWPTGIYRGEVRLERKGQPALVREAGVAVR